MIVRRQLSGIRLFFAMRGSVLSRIWVRIAVTTVLAAVVTWTEGFIFSFKVLLTPTPFTMVGLALAIFLGFRNTASYERFWEGRRLWGDLTNTCRSLTRQLLTLVGPAPASSEGGESPAHARMVYRLIAFVHALRHQLRDTDPAEELRPLLPAEEWARLPEQRSVPTFILQQLALDLRRCVDQGRLSEWLLPSLDANLTHLTAILGGCERIKSTPLPFSFVLLLHRTVYMYCFLLPFGLVDSLGPMTPVMVAFISYTFFGLDALGDEIEEPFGLMPNDLPLLALSRNIEINLRQLLGESPLPEPILPHHHDLP